MIGAVLWGEDEAKSWFIEPMKLKNTAEYLGVSQYKLRKWVKENKIPYSRINNKYLFHKTIIDAWKNGKFPNGEVKIVLDNEIIDIQHEEALREHYKRYPELLEKKEIEDRISKPIAYSNIEYKIKHEGVYLTVGDKNSVEVTVCLSHTSINELCNDLKRFRLNK
ncbi:hypothetical protein GCM10028778_16090 [Barrientosiimonas marina]|uniref:Helix-turn-helix domain-containing protein n=1 Tax=Lentibacillus kimchii TaxID=1542911 RepID=A0ABW2UTR5_9BACI